MKPLQTCCLIITIALSVSCHKSDDENSPDVAYFPKEIVTEYTEPPSNVQMSIAYDSQNRISKYTLSDGTLSSEYDVAYNGANEIITITHNRASETSTENRIYNFQYTNGIITGIIKISSDPITNPILTYDEVLNRYTVQVGSFGSNAYGFDESGGLNYLRTGYFTATFNYTTNDGVFGSVGTNYLPIFYSITFSGLSRGFYECAFLSHKEIESLVQTNSEIFKTITNSRNEQDLIAQIIYTNGTSSNIHATSTIEYESRTVNH